ncbi:MAG: helix-turn-helix domain-containing protein [Actinobacteria bacterium]|nr:helix-turn-helix domain-containing protein [Actinomycetota bacterium]
MKRSGPNRSRSLPSTTACRASLWQRCAGAWLFLFLGEVTGRSTKGDGRRRKRRWDRRPLGHRRLWTCRARGSVTRACQVGILGTGQAKVSGLLVGRLDNLSTERLIRYLNALDRDVQIIVSPKPRTRARDSQGDREITILPYQ